MRCSRLLALLGLMGFGLWPGAAPAAGEAVKLTGAGATFPQPLYQRWLEEYRKLRPDVDIRYEGVGSAAGVQRFLDGQVDFGATDEPMTDEQIRRAKAKIIHMPMTVGAVVPVYNLPVTVRFSGETLAEIFLGKVRRWDDGAIARDNPGVKLPARPIVVVHRSDGSGTTFVWADFLAKVSPEWHEKMGAPGPTARWPVGQSAAGNDGVVQFVKKTPGTIGYVELSYAQKGQLSHGAVRNAMGEYVSASAASLTAAAAAARVPSDYRVSITNGLGKGVYPVASYSWLVLNLFMEDQRRSAALKGFLRWALSEGQALGQPLGFAPLPKVLAQREVLDVDSLR